MNVQPFSALAIAAGLAMATAAAIGGTGCAGTETGNPFQVELRADAHSSDPAAVAVGAGGAVVVDQAWLALDPMVWFPSFDCVGTIAGESADFGTADHAAAGAVLEEFELSETTYCRALLPFVPAAAPLPDGAPADLEGSSVVITGEVVASGTPFRLVSRLERTVDIRKVGQGFELDADRPGLFLGFDVATWFAGVDLASAELDGDGVAVIDETTNAELLSAFESDLAAGVELYRDLDQDGSVDAPDDELLARGQ
jgi:hypothetical protein